MPFLYYTLYISLLRITISNVLEIFIDFDIKHNFVVEIIGQSIMNEIVPYFILLQSTKRFFFAGGRIYHFQ